MREQGWKDRTTRFLSAQAISLLGSSIVQYAIAWWIVLETDSGTMAMLAVIAAFLPQIAVSPFAGVLLDRYNRKYIIMISDSVIALATLILFIVMHLGYSGLTPLFIALVVRSIGTGVQQPAVNAVIPQLAEEKHLMRINSIYATLVSFMVLGAAMIAGALLGFFGLGTILLVDVFTAIIGVGITATIFFPRPDTSEELESSGISDLKAGFSYLRTHTFVKRLLTFQALILFLISPVFMIPIITMRNMDGGVFEFAAIETVYGIGAVIGGILITWLGGFKNRIANILLVSLAFGVLMIGLGFAGFIAFNILVFIWGVLGPSFDASFITSLQERVEPEMHGRVFSFMNIVIAASLPLGMTVFGPLADIVSIEWLFWFSGVSVIALTVFARYGLKLEKV
jgi:DHA3 family macrolide efflux protein-like MFS transporter